MFLLGFLYSGPRLQENWTIKGTLISKLDIYMTLFVVNLSHPIHV